MTIIMIWTETLNITGDLPVRIWIWKKLATVVIIVVGIVATAFFAQDPASEGKKRKTKNENDTTDEDDR